MQTQVDLGLLQVPAALHGAGTQEGRPLGIHTGFGQLDGSIVEIASEQLVMTGGVRGRGLAEPDWEIPDQFHAELRHDRPGVVSLLPRGRTPAAAAS